MKTPKPVSIQTVNALKKDPQVYESHKSLIDAHNQLVQFVGVGTPVSTSHVAANSLGAKPAFSASGTVNRGKMSVTVGSGASNNGEVRLNFPPGTWDGAPSAIVTQNGGNGTSKFNWTENESHLSVQIANPVEGETYVFQYQIRN